jgi:hypothetical protein
MPDQAAKLLLLLLLRQRRAASEGMAPEGELALLYFVVPVGPGRSRLMSLPLATDSKFRWALKLRVVSTWQPTATAASI